MQVLDRPDALSQGGASWTPVGPPAAPAGDQRASRAEVVSLLAMVGAAQVGLPDVLEHVAERALALVPAADGVVVAVRRPSGAVEVAATEADARGVDALQRGLREGPVLDAVTAGLPVGTGDLSGDGRWPRLASSVGTLDVRSALSLALAVDGTVLGTVTAYARRRDSFPADEDEHAAAVLLARFAAEVGDEVEAALGLERARALTVQGELAEADRPAVDRALDLLADEHGVGSEEALAVLALLGRTEEQDLPTAAHAVLGSATGSRDDDHGRRSAG